MSTIYELLQGPIITPRVVRQYQAAAGAGAVFELQARMLADLSPSIGPDIAHARFFATPFDAIQETYADELQEGEAAQLVLAKKLRDKIIHSDFHDADKRHRELVGDENVPSGGAIQFSFDTPKQFVADLADGAGTPVSSTSSTQEGRFYGWLIEVLPQLPGIEEQLLIGAGVFYRLCRKPR